MSEARKYSAEIYQDGDSAHWRDNQSDIFIYQKEVTSADSVKLRIAPGGGFAIKLTSLNEDNLTEGNCGAI